MTLFAAFGAVLKIPGILRGRAAERPFIKYSDKEIFLKLREV